MRGANKPEGPIDCHVHFLPQHYVELAEGGSLPGIRLAPEGGVEWLETGPGRRYPVPLSLRREDALISELEGRGMGAAVLSPPPMVFHYDFPEKKAALLAEALNRGLAEAAGRHPGALKAMGYLPMQHPDLAAGALSMGVDRYGLRAFAIGSNIAGSNLDNPGFQPVFALAEERDVVIFVHPWAPLGQDRLSCGGLNSVVGLPVEAAVAGCCLILGGVMDRFPRLRFFLAHGGGALTFLAGRLHRLAEVRSDCRLARKPREYLKSLYYDSIVLSTAALDYLVGVAGADRVLLGSDAPYHLGETGDPDAVKSVNGLTQVPAGGICRILWENAAEIFFR